MMQIGQLLVQKGYITQQQLEAALSQQGDGQVGQLLINWGWLTQEQLSEALSAQAPPPPPPTPPVYAPPPVPGSIQVPPTQFQDTIGQASLQSLKERYAPVPPVFS